MLYLIGLGLGDEKDLTVRGLEAIEKCDLVYFESYTSIYRGNFEKLEEGIGHKIIFADRKMVEVDSEEILVKAQEGNTALLVMGDVFSATTHSDLVLRANEMNIEISVIHNASILTAVGDTGLSLYKFGKTASIPFLTENWKVDSPYDILKDNLANGQAHTLFLLDLKVKEGKTMTFNEAVQFLLDIEERRKEKLFSSNTVVVGCAGLGYNNAEIFYGKATDLMKKSSKVFPQCLIIPGKLHFIEEEMLERFAVGSVGKKRIKN